ncbi:MAG: cupredoxin domain-containing protein [Actinomycetota bacterium]
MRRAMSVAAILGTVLVPSVEARASGGGGCGAPITEGTGDQVAIRQFCFEPTVLVMPAGGEVTFTNQDGFQHNVLGANATWGSFARLGGGEARTYALDEPGVYPYVCSWHPGMVGAVVVGDGASAQAIVAEPAGLTRGGSVEVASSASGWKTVAVATGGLLVLIVAGTAGLRRRLREDERG